MQSSFGNGNGNGNGWRMVGLGLGLGLGLGPVAHARPDPRGLRGRQLPSHPESHPAGAGKSATTGGCGSTAEQETTETQRHGGGTEMGWVTAELTHPSRPISTMLIGRQTADVGGWPRLSHEA